MLGKLLKYEFKSTGRLLCLMYALLLAAGVFVGICSHIPDGRIFTNSIAFGIFVVIYILLAFAMIVVTLVMIIGRFYKNLLQGEGYLMHTLPVPTWMHLASKTISAFVWEVAAVAVLLFSLMLIFLTGGAWQSFLEDYWRPFFQDLTAGEISLMILFIVVTCVQFVRIILMFYLSMSIGASVTRHKVFFSVLAFFVIAIVISVIELVVNLGWAADTVLSLPLTVTVDAAETGVNLMRSLFIRTLIEDAVLAAIFFILSNFFLKNKLNLE